MLNIKNIFGKPLKPLLFYFLPLAFIFSWWFYFFYYTQPTNVKIPSTIITSQIDAQTNALFPYLSDLNRDKIHKALLGDFDLITELIATWDIDAQILESNGINGIQRINQNSLLQAHLIHRTIKINQKDEKPHQSHKRFLPQTYAAATFLFAIAPPNEILAIPKGMREFPQLYSTSLLKTLDTNVEDIKGEKLFLIRPDLTFISNYSHPETIVSFQRQQLNLFCLNGCDTIADIKNCLLKLGSCTNHQLEAQLLNFFIDACMINLDNRLLALNNAQVNVNHLADSTSLKKILFLYHNQSFMVPTIKTLSGQLLERATKNHLLISCPISYDQTEWFIPCSKEAMAKENPDYLIISTSHLGKLNQHAENSFFNHSTVKNIYYIDEDFQESPTQLIALAYYDIFQAFAAIHTKITS